MARARNIKPGFFKNEELADASCEIRLLFIGLWTLADREGRLEDRPRRIRAEIFPFDGFDVDPMLARLQALGFLTRYEVGGERFIQVTNFVKHQDPHYREKASEIPPPPGVVNEIVATGVTRTQRARILERDGHECQQCGSREQPCIDHVIPVSKGGDSSDANLQVLCLSCNTKKGNSIGSTSAQRRPELESIKEPVVPLIPDSLIPDSLFTDSLIPESTPAASQPTLAPKAKRKAKEPKTRIAENFGVSDRVAEWAEKNGHSHLAEHLDAFARKCRAKGYEYVNWDDAFMEAIRADWAGLGKGRSPPPGKTGKFDPVAFVNRNRPAENHERTDNIIDV